MSEPRAPYGLPGAPVQANPPDLSDKLREALTRLGFAVQVLHSPEMTRLLADWQPPGGPRYHLAYTHYHAPGRPHLGYVSLATGELAGHCLVSDTHVRKVSQVRLLRLHNRHYKAARQTALDAGTLQPA